LQYNPNKSLILKIVFIAAFTLAGLFILIYMLLNTLDDPRAIKRALGFESFASFILMSGGGILTVVLLFALILFVLRSFLFSKKLHGPVDALHTIITQFEEGNYEPREDAIEKLPVILQRDTENLRNELIGRYAAVDGCLSEIKGVAENLRRITVDSNLRISFLHAQLDDFDKGIARLEQAFSHIRVPRPDTLSSVLILGSGPGALALASALVLNEDAEFAWLLPPPAGGLAALADVLSANAHPARASVAALQASLPVQGKARFACTDIQDENELAAFAHREKIPLCILADSNPENARRGELFVKAGIPVCGLGIRPQSPAHEEGYLRSLLTQAKVPCLPAGAGAASGREYAFTAISDGRTIRILGAAELALGIEDGDRGRTSGGMGAFAPAFAEGDPLPDRVCRQFCKKIHAALRQDGALHRGFISLRISLSGNGKLLLRSLDFGLTAPECEVTLLSFGHGIARLALAACQDTLAKEECAPARQSALSIVFRPSAPDGGASAPQGEHTEGTSCGADTGGSTAAEELPVPPWNIRIARYPEGDPDRRAFSLVCSRASEEETVHAAYLAAHPILEEGRFACRGDIGRAALAGRRKEAEARSIPLLARIQKWFTRDG